MSRNVAFQQAERALLDERRPLTREEVVAVAQQPFDELPDLVALAHRVRMEYCGPEVELESLINAKSGACPEDCAFCSQSARFHTEVDVYPFLDLDEVLGAARATRDAGATQFCIVVAVFRMFVEFTLLTMALICGSVLLSLLRLSLLRARPMSTRDSMTRNSSVL